MKPLNYLRLFMIFSFVLTLGSKANAQQDENESSSALDYLTHEQQQLLKEQQLLIDKTRSLFKENLTTDQLKLLNDRSINKERRTAMLKKSLTSEQRNIVSSNRDLIRSKKNMFRKSLTKKQRLKLRKFIRKRPLNDRKRLVRRLRRLIQNNMD